MKATFSMKNKRVKVAESVFESPERTREKKIRYMGYKAYTWSCEPKYTESTDNNYREHILDSGLDTITFERNVLSWSINLYGFPNNRRLSLQSHTFFDT